MTKCSQTQSSICYGNELGREKTRSEVKKPWFPSLSGGEKDAEGMSWTKVRELIRCGYRAENHCHPTLRIGDLANRTYR